METPDRVLEDGAQWAVLTAGCWGMGHWEQVTVAFLLRSQLRTQALLYRVWQRPGLERRFWVVFYHSLRLIAFVGNPVISHVEQKVQNRAQRSKIRHVLRILDTTSRHQDSPSGCTAIDALQLPAWSPQFPHPAFIFFAECPW